MAKRTIVWTLTASIQRRVILTYWNNLNKSIIYSEKLINFTKARLNIVLNNPRIGKKTDFPNTRVITLGHYSIFYQYNRKNIIITSFWDNRRDPKRLINLLKAMKIK